MISSLWWITHPTHSSCVTALRVGAVILNRSQSIACIRITWTAASSRHQRDRRNKRWLYRAGGRASSAACCLLFTVAFDFIARNASFSLVDVDVGEESANSAASNNYRVCRISRGWKCLARERSRFTRYSLDAGTARRWVLDLLSFNLPERLRELRCSRKQLIADYMVFRRNWGSRYT